MVDTKMGVVEFIAVRGHTGTDPVDVWFGGRHEAVELYIKTSSTAEMPLKMVPVSIEGIDFSTTPATMLNPPTATTVDHTGATRESVVFFQSPISGIRVLFTSNAGSVDIVVRMSGSLS